eukprot:TRINITY_DN44666_c0_g2_i3.p1 TRINITY_DN44666_c0_g2~~TRINITY_DN44666_c0_g2_i3.p1  ORF type:complete len:157 (+),score=39.72 TRINITY_DN44666_c0_g2_i3:149-619(+)
MRGLGNKDFVVALSDTNSSVLHRFRGSAMPSSKGTQTLANKTKTVSVENTKQMNKTPTGTGNVIRVKGSSVSANVSKTQSLSTPHRTEFATKMAFGAIITSTNNTTESGQLPPPMIVEDSEKAVNVFAVPHLNNMLSQSSTNTTTTTPIRNLKSFQ